VSAAMTRATWSGRIPPPLLGREPLALGKNLLRRDPAAALRSNDAPPVLDERASAHLNARPALAVGAGAGANLVSKHLLSLALAARLDCRDVVGMRAQTLQRGGKLAAVEMRVRVRNLDERVPRKVPLARRERSSLRFCSCLCL